MDVVLFRITIGCMSQKSKIAVNNSLILNKIVFSFPVKDQGWAVPNWRGSIMSKDQDSFLLHQHVRWDFCRCINMSDGGKEGRRRNGMPLPLRT